ncbi:MAG: hypothetical protein JNL19_01935 [Burkholderiales bacterium]|nr:hypothetical protein [Burkholderiales bacterium]
MSFLAAALVVASGCAHQWESTLDGRLYTRTHLHRYPVTIAAVDGVSTSLVPVRIDAGVRRLTVDAQPVAGFHLPDRKEFTFRAEKCVRYWLAAQRPSAYSHDFELVIDNAEVIPGCNPTSGPPSQPVLVPSDLSKIPPPQPIPMPKRP